MGNEKTLTVVLACLRDGTKLLPMVILRRFTVPREQLPSGIVVQCNKDWMAEELMIEWANKVWRGREFLNPDSVLVTGSMSIISSCQ
ncbi:hypothetical protein LDENG_00226780 [Lucifuga dentata]|nr:hypothetical protein LDENG_00226780 [Lucifuga dentata]